MKGSQLLHVAAVVVERIKHFCEELHTYHTMHAMESCLSGVGANYSNNRRLVLSKQDITTYERSF